MPLPVTGQQFFDPDEQGAAVIAINPNKYLELYEQAVNELNGGVWTFERNSPAFRWVNEQLAKEYQNNIEYYSTYSADSYNPSRQTSVSGTVYTGLNPGVALDLQQYELDAAAQAQIDRARDTASALEQRDASRYAVDPNQLSPVDTYTYDPTTADIYTAEVNGAFDPTLDQLGYANELNQYATDIDGTALGQAAELQYLAATGQMPSFADRSLQRDANALFAAQNAMAARARGSSGAGLALMNAQNNSALGYAQLLNAADIARAQEMTDARAALAQTGGVIRQGDFQGANQAAQIGQQLYAINNSELGAGIQNANMLNQGAQYNTNTRNQATQFNVGQMQSADSANAAALQQTLTANQQAAMQTGNADDLLLKDYNTTLIAAGENDRAAAITGEQNFQQTASANADRLANVQTDNMAASAQLTGQREAAEAQQNAAIIGAGGAAVGGLLQALSDRRAKDLIKPTAEADFTDAEDYEYEYNEHAGPMEGEHRKGPMADDLPEDVVMRGDDGMLRVNIEKLAMRQAAAIGKLQREVASLKGKRA